jgi:hypothetical protein
MIDRLAPKIEFVAERGDVEQFTPAQREQEGDSVRDGWHRR